MQTFGAQTTLPTRLPNFPPALNPQKWTTLAQIHSALVMDIIKQHLTLFSGPGALQNMSGTCLNASMVAFASKYVQPTHAYISNHIYIYMYVYGIYIYIYIYIYISGNGKVPPPLKEDFWALGLQ